MTPGMDMSSGCCHVPHGCVFTKALQSRLADCEHATRRSVGEATALDCRSPPAQANCALLASLLHERARFALKLGAGNKPLLHMQALRLQCGGLLALQRHLRTADSEAAVGGQALVADAGAFDGDARAGVEAAAQAAAQAAAGAQAARVACVHRLVQQAQARHGSLTELPWQRLVADVSAWTPRQRRPGAGR